MEGLRFLFHSCGNLNQELPKSSSEKPLYLLSLLHLPIVTVLLVLPLQKDHHIMLVVLGKRPQSQVFYTKFSQSIMVLVREHVIIISFLLHRLFHHHLHHRSHLHLGQRYTILPQCLLLRRVLLRNIAVAGETCRRVQIGGSRWILGLMMRMRSTKSMVLHLFQLCALMAVVRMLGPEQQAATHP